MSRDVIGVAAASFPLAIELTPAPDFWSAAQRLLCLPSVLVLESVSGLPALARYSFLTAMPFRQIRAWQGKICISHHRPNGELSGSEEVEADPFALLQQHLRDFRLEHHPDLPPFQTGAAGLFGYDLCHHLERLPRPPWTEFAVPDMVIGFYDWVLAFDHPQQRAWIVASGLPARGSERRRRARRRLEQVAEWLTSDVALSRQRCWPQAAERIQASAPPALAPLHPVAGVSGLFSNFDRESYLAAIRRAIEYVHAGDCYQVNIAQRLLYPAAGIDPVQLFGRLRQRNPAPFAGYFDLGDFVIVSASPERFLTLHDGLVVTRPIKGTRPRGKTPGEDAALRRELEASAKDRAENVMIVDLLRNDLGRVCRYGSVEVASVCQVESYQYVHHLVSEVRGRLREGLGAVDLLRAAFPGGSVTGAPKIRAMEIIAELEGVARGPYCGCLGYIGFDGTMDTNILIRTFTLGQSWGQFPVGGGIVADSVPELEYEETWHKARGLMRALETE